MKAPKYYKVDYRTTDELLRLKTMIVKSFDMATIYNSLENEIPNLREIYKVEIYIGVTKHEIDLTK